MKLPLWLIFSISALLTLPFATAQQGTGQKILLITKDGPILWEVGTPMPASVDIPTPAPKRTRGFRGMLGRSNTSTTPRSADSRAETAAVVPLSNSARNAVESRQSTPAAPHVEVQPANSVAEVAPATSNETATAPQNRRVGLSGFRLPFGSSNSERDSQTVTTEGSEEAAADETDQRNRSFTIGNLFRRNEGPGNEAGEPEIAMTSDGDPEIVSQPPSGDDQKSPRFSFLRRAQSGTSAGEVPALELDLGETLAGTYFTVKVASELHVVDEGRDETIVTKLSPGAVGRSHGYGDSWRWLELESGLIGLIRNADLRGATEAEIDSFLEAEKLSGGSSSSDTLAQVAVEMKDLADEFSSIGGGSVE